MFLFNAGAQGLLAGTINWASDTIRARLVESADTPDEDATSMTGIGVTGNDQTLGTKVGPTKDDTNDRITYGAANPVFAGQPLGDPVDKLVIFKHSTDDAGSTPIALMAISEVTPNGGDVSIAFDGGLVMTLHNQP